MLSIEGAQDDSHQMAVQEQVNDKRMQKVVENHTF